MIWVGLFGSFTYLVLSAWAHIVFGDRYQWMSDVRLISIMSGSLLYALVLRTAMRPRANAGGPALLALYVVGASLIMLVLRYSADQALSDLPLGIGQHVMWVLVWAGYFGLWVSAFREMEWRNTATRPFVRASVVPERAAKAAAVARPDRLDSGDAETWSWIIDALADEMSRNSPEAQAELLGNLQRRAGYELVDDGTGIVTAHNRRVTLVENLARRTARTGHRSPGSNA